MFDAQRNLRKRRFDRRTAAFKLLCPKWIITFDLNLFTLGLALDPRVFVGIAFFEGNNRGFVRPSIIVHLHGYPFTLERLMVSNRRRFGVDKQRLGGHTLALEAGTQTWVRFPVNCKAVLELL
ncbi:hypothetical protein [Microvirga sp. TS319]|uniref:hypothetical protein n=1 Tax=Microvirga sp. TS319 TaxID=3241165 RepID=UPI00351A58F7